MGCDIRLKLYNLTDQTYVPDCVALHVGSNAAQPNVWQCARSNITVHTYIIGVDALGAPSFGMHMALM